MSIPFAIVTRCCRSSYGRGAFSVTYMLIAFYICRPRNDNTFFILKIKRNKKENVVCEDSRKVSLHNHRWCLLTVDAHIIHNAGK